MDTFLKILIGAVFALLIAGLKHRLFSATLVINTDLEIRDTSVGRVITTRVHNPGLHGALGCHAQLQVKHKKQTAAMSATWSGGSHETINRGADCLLSICDVDSQCLQFVNVKETTDLTVPLAELPIEIVLRVTASNGTRPSSIKFSIGSKGTELKISCTWASRLRQSLKKVLRI